MRWADWVIARGLSWAAAARRAGVTTSEARHFAHGRIPRPVTMRRIYLATGGEVTPNDFYALPDLTDAPAPEGGAAPLPPGTNPDYAPEPPDPAPGGRLLSTEEAA